MKTKLTLSLDDAVIERAKAYAARRGTSVSGLVEDYFRLIAAEPGGAPGGDGAPTDGPADDWMASLSPRVRALVGSAVGPATEHLREGDAAERAYRDYLARKYS